MIEQTERKNLRTIWSVSAIALMLILLWPGLAKNLLTANGFIPHGHCYLWKSQLLWLHISSDTSIALAYLAISATLVYLIYKTREDIPFHWMFLAFGSFILACGSTHIMEVWTLWHPVYWLSGGLKLMTAVASVTTALILPTLVPKALRLVEAAKLSEQRRLNVETANEELGTLYEKLKKLDQLKSNFFANVSHELRTPLALILGPTEQLLAAAELREEQRANLEVVARNARILLKQVNDLLDISKLEAGKMELQRTDVDLAEMIRLSATYFEAVARDRQISLTVETPEFLPARVDAEKLQRVILNLLSNAFKFTPQGGRICCILSAKFERVTIAIQDSGPGVPPELRETIFERFQQGELGTNRRFGGTGLGLAIVKEFVELHNGHVSITDAPIGGALFTVEIPLVPPVKVKSPILLEAINYRSLALPLLEELQISPQAAIAPDDREADKPLILIVEDNLEMNQFLAQSLATEYRIARAFNGEEGLQQAMTLHPDLILTDVMMPQMSGDRLVRQLRTHPELDTSLIVVLTAKADDDLRVRLLQEGVQDYLMKPFSIEELRTRIDNLITIKWSRDLLQEELASQSQNLQILTKEVAQSRRELKKALEVQQQQSEDLVRSNRLKDEFLAIVSHELRTPLNSILGWSQLMRNHKLNEATSNKGLETIERNAKQQVKLIDDILDVSRIIRGQVRLNMISVKLERIVEEILESFLPAIRAKNLQIETLFTSSGNKIFGDRDRLGQVVWNLLSNAIKFTPSGERIEVAIARTNSSVQLRVTDTGIGINPEFLPYIFDSFRQADGSTTRTYGGLGLGLTIGRYLVELHGGTIMAFSEGKNKGATFLVQLPLAEENLPARQQESARIKSKELANYLWLLDGLRVLVVDDDPDTCELISTVLAHYGVNVTAVSSAIAALEAMEKIKPNILLSDIGMPGNDGYDLIRQIRQIEADRGEEIPAIALTAFAREDDRRQAMQAGFQMHLPKPVEPSILAAAIAKLAAQI